MRQARTPQFLLQHNRMKLQAYFPYFTYRTAVTAAALLLLKAFACTGQTRTLTLDDALRIADEQSVDIRRARVALERSQKAIQTAQAAWLPEAGFNGDLTWNIKRPVLFLPPGTPLNPGTGIQSFETGSRYATGVSATLTWPLYDPAKNAQGRLAETGTDISRAQLSAVRTQVRMNATKAFYRSLYARSEQITREAQIETAAKNLQIVLARYREGRATPLDTLTAATTVVRAQAQAERAGYNERTARLTLANVLEISNYETIEVKGTLQIPAPPGPSGGDTPVMATPETTGRTGSLITPAQELAVARRVAAQAERDAERAGLYPTVNAVGKVQATGQDNTLDPADAKWAVWSQAGLTASYTLSNIWRNDPKREEAELKVKEAELELLRIRQDDSVQVDQLLLRLRGARALAAAETATVTQSQKSVEIATILYKEGRATLLELESAQSKLLDARLAAERAALEYFENYAELQALLWREGG